MTGAGLSERAVALLEAELEQLPPDAGRPARYAVEYSLGRYRVGIERYRDALEGIGFTGAGRAVDVGSGAGHWCVALALLNEHVDGVEPREEFVEVARKVATGLGLGDAVEYWVGTGESADYPRDAFELACCHSVLMFAGDPELVLRNVAGWLRPGGRFYLGYSGLGLRLAAISGALEKQSVEQMGTSADVILASLVYRCGVYHTPRTRVRMATPGELLRLLEALGFASVARPGIQDGAREFAGVPGTFDFVLEKRESEPLKRRLLELAASDTTAAASALRQAVDDGLPGTALEVLAEAGSPGDDAHRDVRVRALVKAGRSAEVTSRDERGLAEPLLGILRFDQRKPRDAAKLLRGAPGDDPDARFLLACALLELGDVEEAEELFALDEDAFRGAAGRLTVARARGDEAAILDAAESLLAEVRRQRPGDGARDA